MEYYAQVPWPPYAEPDRARQIDKDYQLQRFFEQISSGVLLAQVPSEWVGTAGGTANALALTPTPVIPNYIAGQIFWFRAAATNTGATTVSVSGLAAKAIQIIGVALVAGQIVINQLYEIIYDGTAFQLQGDRVTTLTGEVTGSGVGSFATTLTNAAVIAKVLTGYTSGAGTVAATDTILQAIQKLNGNTQNSTGQWAGTAGGTANALTLTLAPAITAYVAGQAFRFKASASTNTAATTVAVSGLATKAVQVNGAALSGGEIVASQWYEVVYDGAAFQLKDISTFLPAGGVARPEQEKMREIVSVTDFMTAAQKADYLAQTKTLDLTAVLNTAFSTVGYIIRLGYGDARFDTGLTEPVCAGIVGPGPEFSKLTANTGITKALPLGAECRVHKGYQLVGNATTSARGFVLGDSEGGDYLFESVRCRGFTGSGAAGWFIKMALKTELMQCLGQGNFMNWLIDGTGTSYPTTIDLIGCGNADATDVGMKIIHAETVRIIGGFSDSNAKEGIQRLPAAGNTLANVVTMHHRYEANYGATSTEYQSTGNGVDGTCHFSELYPVFASAGAKSARFAGSFCSGHLELPDVPNSAATVLIENEAVVTRHLPGHLPTSVISDTTGQSFSVNWGQIEFPSTQNPSTNANTFDDYEEGTFTPTIILGAGSVTYTSQAGSYVKKGREVTVHGKIVVNVATTPSGTLEIGALPFTAGATQKGAANIFCDNFAATAATSMVGRVTASTTNIRVLRFAAGAAANPGADVQNTSIIEFSAIYDV